MLQCHATSVKFNENFVYLYTSEEILPYFTIAIQIMRSVTGQVCEETQSSVKNNS